MNNIELTDAAIVGEDAAAFEELIARAKDWAAQDPNQDTVLALNRTIFMAKRGDATAIRSLKDGFCGRIKFGTAGLRGELGPGPARMNRVLVGQAAAGLAAYLNKRKSASAPIVVIGFDARRESDRFASDSAQIFAGAGCRVYLFPRALPTPLLAYAVRALGADAGVMVTASHNPPNDNGYKVYLGGELTGPQLAGSQIAPPVDAEISAEIDLVAQTLTFAQLPKSTAFTRVPAEIIDDYIACTAAVAPAGADSELRWVYTAMHGVGYQTIREVVAASGYPQPVPVREQVQPDAKFPTVAFPNPEEPGALDLAFAAADESGADLVLANDPDADRLAVAVRDHEGGWVQLSGNQIGLLLGWWRARNVAEAASESASLVCSLVSSPALKLVAEHYGLAFHATLTGFKWIVRAPGLVYGFEEALGYLVNPETVLDKDGISAAVAILSLADELRRDGRNLLDLWDDFCDKFGYFESTGLTLRLERRAELGALMARLREISPTSFGSFEVSETIDYLPEFGNDLVEFRLGESDRVLIRPSGTEAKLKIYLDVRGASPAEAAAKSAELAASARELLAKLS